MLTHTRTLSRARIATLALLATAAPALANPVTWYTNPGPISSSGLLGNVNNAVVTLPMPAVPAGGGGAWSYLTISGNLTEVNTSTYASEACIEVTLPSGGKFVVKPFETNGFTTTIAIPPGSDVAPPYPLTSAAGQCTFRFFELYVDNPSGPDSTWSNLTFTLHDSHGNDPFPFSVDIPTDAANPDDDTDGNWFTKGQQVNGQITTFTVNRVVDSFRFKGYGTAMCGWSSSSSRSPLSFARYTFTAERADGNGTVSWSVLPFGEFSPSTAEFDLTMDTPVPVLTGPTHPWSYTLAETDTPPPPAAAGTRMAAVWLGIQPIGPDAPAATDLGIIRGNPALGPAETAVVATQTFASQPHELKWFTFTTEQICSNATGYWLDIHTRTVAGSPIVDQELGMYSPSGHRLASDDDGGSNAQSMLTFGAGSPVRAPIDPTGGPYPRDGHNGFLPAGLHYLAVPQFYSQFADTGWYINVQGNVAGAMAFDIRTNLPPAPPAPCGPADLGSAGGVAGADGALDNNDFIAFINLFFTQNIAADLGIAGGGPGNDGTLDNNDFIAFITLFFAGCP